MTSLMDTFEQQYAALTADITSRTGRISNLSGVEKKLFISQAERQMEEAHELLEQMELEVKSMLPVPRQKYQIRLKSYITELSLLDKELRARISFQDDLSSREELFDIDYVKDDQKQLLLDNTERLERSSKQLEGGYKLAVEAEQMGAEILTDLSSQRETIRKAKERVRETNYDLGKSSRIASSLIKGLLQQKIFAYTAASAVLLTVIVAVYLVYRKHS